MRLKLTIPMAIGIVLIAIALIAPFFGRWDIATFLPRLGLLARSQDASMTPKTAVIAFTIAAGLWVLVALARMFIAWNAPMCLLSCAAGIFCCIRAIQIRDANWP